LPPSSAVAAIDGLRIPLPRPSSRALAKLVSDRTGEKDDHNLLVVAGLLVTMTPATRPRATSRPARAEHLSMLSLLEAKPGMRVLDENEWLTRVTRPVLQRSEERLRKRIVVADTWPTNDRCRLGCDRAPGPARRPCGGTIGTPATCTARTW
jgi:hypothetical protein